MAMTTGKKTEDQIILENISKTFPYPLPQEYLRMIFCLPLKHKTIKALNGININIKKGEMLGVLGRNGSGKSTLLRVVAGLHTHDKGGKLKVKGSMAAIFEMGLASNMFLSGREYCHRYFRFIGNPQHLINNMIDDVKEFSELGNFFDEYINTYSTGMRARLFFSILMTQDEVGIYLLDEILSVGDELFQKKSYKRLIRMISSNNASGIFATHDWQTAMRICDNILILNKGNTEFQGSAEEAVLKFMETNSSVQLDNSKGEIFRKQELMTQLLPFTTGKNFVFTFEFELKEAVAVACSISIEIPRQGLILHIARSKELVSGQGKYRVRVITRNVPFAHNCMLSIGVCAPWLPGEAGTRLIYDLMSWTIRNGIKMSNENNDMNSSVLNIPVKWKRIR